MSGSGRTVFSLSEDETRELGRAFAARLRGGELVLLVGELGLGKTVFVRGVADALGIDPEEVCSPSYALVHQYDGGRIPLIHVDLYRVDTAEELATLGLDELLESGAVVVVEWGERMPASWSRGAMCVAFHDLGEDSRRIELLVGGAAPRAADA